MKRQLTRKIKNGNMELSNISWYAVAFRIPFTGTRGPSPTIQSDKNCPPVNRQTQTGLSGFQTEKLQRASPLLLSPLAVFSTASSACIPLGDVWIDVSAQPWKTTPWSSPHTVLKLISSPHTPNYDRAYIGSEDNKCHLRDFPTCPLSNKEIASCYLSTHQTAPHFYGHTASPWLYISRLRSRSCRRNTPMCAHTYSRRA